ncbi:uncharacterized mitochondrial protein AtMg00810-like [Lycium barbarum]|uniref:uncharacterized mitochondrial protein AtMg00810-like n=1 Tax=Lycium barbarum TaxID=112863 RepID=UPI00293EB692|nr:uncharacterized mitochondrial protein AtMg00810-like [Lycium barbarum]
MAFLASEFAMKDPGPLNYFLGIHVTRHKDGMFLSQCKYAEEIIDRAGMSFCKATSTPVETKPKVCLHMHAPREVHMHALKRIICYIQGTLDYGLHLYPSSVTDLLSYPDAD